MQWIIQSALFVFAVALGDERLEKSDGGSTSGDGL
jgi:hypothetical protein